MEPISEPQGVACHTMLPATRHKRTHPALTPASNSGTRFAYPGGMECWGDLTSQESNPRPLDRKSDALTAMPPIYCYIIVTITVMFCCCWCRLNEQDRLADSDDGRQLSVVCYLRYELHHQRLLLAVSALQNLLLYLVQKGTWRRVQVTTCRRRWW